MYAEAETNWLKENFEPQYREEVRHRKSLNASRYLSDNDAVYRPGEIKTFKYNKDEIRKIGKDWLVCLYENFCDFRETAKQLNIRESTLRTRIRDLRKLLEKMEITPELLDSQLRKH